MKMLRLKECVKDREAKEEVENRRLCTNTHPSKSREQPSTLSAPEEIVFTPDIEKIKFRAVWTAGLVKCLPGLQEDIEFYPQSPR